MSTNETRALTRPKDHSGEQPPKSLAAMARKGLLCPTCRWSPNRIERTPEGRRTCANGHTWRIVNGRARKE